MHSPAVAISELQETNEQLLRAWPEFVQHIPSSILREFSGVQAAWANASLPFYNAVFLSKPVSDGADLASRLRAAAEFMKSQPKSGVFIVCEDWIPEALRSEFKAKAAEINLQPLMPLTGMVTTELRDPIRPLPEIEIRGVEDAATRQAVSDINCLAYQLPVEWGSETVALPEAWRSNCFGSVAYAKGNAVSSAATWIIDGRLYVGLVATLPEQQRHGYAEAVMRHSLKQAMKATGISRTTLHASAAGRPVYERMGYRAVGNFTVYAFPHEPGASEEKPAH